MMMKHTRGLKAKKTMTLLLISAVLMTLVSQISIAEDAMDVTNDTAPYSSIVTSDHGWIYGKCTDQNGNPFNFVCIIASRPALSVTEAASSRYITYSLDSGEYRIAALPGKYTIEAHKKGYSVETAVTVKVEQGKGTNVDFELKQATLALAGYGWLRGTVYGVYSVSPATSDTASGTQVKIPLQGARIAVGSPTAASKSSFSTTFTDEEGHYEIQLRPGTYLVIASKGPSSQQKQITIADQKVTDLDFLLKVDRVAIQLNDSITAGGLGGEITVSSQGDNTYLNDIVIYNDMAIEPIAISSTELSIRVSGDESSSGKLVVITIDQEVFSPEGALGVQYDETHISAVSSLDDVTGEQESKTPVYVLTREENTTRVVVYIPHFSEHVITIAEIGEVLVEPPAIILYAAISVILIVVVVAPVVLVQKKGKQ